jgi:hypothetical protein
VSAKNGFTNGASRSFTVSEPIYTVLLMHRSYADPAAIVYCVVQYVSRAIVVSRVCIYVPVDTRSL